MPIAVGELKGLDSFGAAPTGLAPSVLLKLLRPGIHDTADAPQPVRSREPGGCWSKLPVSCYGNPWYRDPNSKGSQPSGTGKVLEVTPPRHRALESLPLSGLFFRALPEIHLYRPPTRKRCSKTGPDGRHRGNQTRRARLESASCHVADFASEELGSGRGQADAFYRGGAVRSCRGLRRPQARSCSALLLPTPRSTMMPATLNSPPSIY